MTPAHTRPFNLCQYELGQSLFLSEGWWEDFQSILVHKNPSSSSHAHSFHLLEFGSLEDKTIVFDVAVFLYKTLLSSYNSSYKGDVPPCSGGRCQPRLHGFRDFLCQHCVQVDFKWEVGWRGSVAFLNVLPFRWFFFLTVPYRIKKSQFQTAVL